MFHKRLMQEFRDNMKYVAGMVATQWLMLIANVFFMYTLAGFISSAADGTAKTADLQKIFIQHPYISKVLPYRDRSIM